jgi:hypothetical protein
MYIALTQRGGFLGRDRNVEVQDDDLTVSENGAVQQSRRLDGAERMQLEDLAAKALPVTGHIVRRTGTTPSDSMDTELEIEVEGTRTKVTIASGDQAPDEVWKLIGELGRLSS